MYITYITYVEIFIAATFFNTRSGVYSTNQQDDNMHLAPYF